MSEDWKRTTRQKIIELQQGGESYREMAVRLSVQLRQVIPHYLLYDIARGKSQPTRQLARALGVVTERDGDRVRFGVWMTRAERRELQAEIDASGMTRREWLEREKTAGSCAGNHKERDAMREIPFVATQDEVLEILRRGRVQFRRPFKPQPELLTAGGAWLYDGEIFVGDDAMQSHLFHDVYGNGKSPYGGVNGDGTGDRLWVKETLRTMRGVWVYAADGEFLLAARDDVEVECNAMWGLDLPAKARSPIQPHAPMGKPSYARGCQCLH